MDIDRASSLVSYFRQKYPWSLSKPTLVKLLYLTDWLSALKQQETITGIKWVYHMDGPGSRDVDLLFNALSDAGVTPADKSIADEVIEKTGKLEHADFLKLVYSTFPMVVSERFAELNLVELARKYKPVGAP